MYQAHEYYQPNETESQFIAAGILSVGEVDMEYQEYLKRADSDYPMSYKKWNDVRRRLDELHKIYYAEIEPLYLNHDHIMTYSQEIRADDLLAEISNLEIALGY